MMTLARGVISQLHYLPSGVATLRFWRIDISWVREALLGSKHRHPVNEE
jgi:hypothetical protein